MNPAPRLLYVVTEDWYFVSHRLPLACAARDAGFDVAVATRVANDGARIMAAGLQLLPLELSRGGLNPLRDLALMFRLWRLYRRVRPDLVHHVAIKPVLYGSIAAWLARVPATVNALGGLGFVFRSRAVAARILRPVVRLALRFALNRGRGVLIVQTHADRRAVVEGGLVPATRVRLIRGSGVDLKTFRPQPEAHGAPLVILAARLLWDKGVGEFVAAARLLRARGSAARFALVGDVDPDNPSSVPDAQLEAWRASGDVECWGRRADMPEVMAQAQVVCLPSHHEGVPKVLLEAAAVGRPIVASDIPGCREVVTDGVNGLLVPVGDAPALAGAVQRLLDDPGLRVRLGQAGRAVVEREFAQELVAAQILELYCGFKPPAGL